MNAWYDNTEGSVVFVVFSTSLQFILPHTYYNNKTSSNKQQNWTKYLWHLKLLHWKQCYKILCEGHIESNSATRLNKNFEFIDCRSSEKARHIIVVS